MKPKLGLACMLLLPVLSTINAAEADIKTSGAPDHALHLCIIYDNYQSDSRLETDWGFACLVEYQGEKQTASP